MKFRDDREKILIIDFGSQVTKLIARRIRELGIYSEVISNTNVEKINSFNGVSGIILSGDLRLLQKKISLKYQIKFLCLIFLYLVFAMDFNSSQ